MKYFIRANTCTGEVNFLQSNLNGIDKIYLIQSEFDYLKSIFISRLCAYIQEHCKNVELICNPNIANLFDGFIIRDKKIAVLDSELMCLNNRCILVDIDSGIKKKKYNQLVYEAYDISEQISQKMNSVFCVYSGAKDIHDEWERVYINNMDFDLLDKYCSSVIENIVPKNNADKKAIIFERFFGTVFFDGNINYIDEITKDIKKRYFIKGRPGTGKSTFLKKFAKALTDKGYCVEIYHCGFDSKSLDMVVCRELSVCIFDSTLPHEKFPDGDTDEILDFYLNSGLSGTDELYKEKLEDISLRYKKIMSVSKMYFEDLFKIREKFNEKIKPNIDYEILNNIVYELLYEII